MIKKIISLFFALLFVGSIAVIKPTQTEAATLSFTAQISTEITPKYEKAHMVFSRKLNGGTYSHIIGSDTNKNGICFVGKTQLSDKTEFVITPLKEGTFDFAMGLYHYNGSSTDMTLCGILEFHVECKQRSDGRFYISNMDSSFAKSGCYSTRTRNVDRYNYIEFKDLSIEKGSGVITYKLTDNSKKDSEITSIAKKYSLEKYYLVNGKHVHSYNNSGVCSKCGIKRYDYNASGFQYLFYKTEAPEKGRLLTVNPKTSDGKTLGIPVQVYLPYGYQNTNKYDVLFLVPGSNGTIYNWMGQSMEMYIPGGEKFDEMSGKRLFDWLIYTRQSKPFIAVSIPMQPYNDSYDQAYSRYVMLIKDYWLPMIIDGQGVYSDGNGNNKEIKFGGTYAKSSKESDITAAKSHFAIAGLSQGSIFVCYYAVNPNSDLGKRFGNKIIMSSYTSANTLAGLYNKGSNNKDKLYFVSGGSLDESGGGSPYKIMEEYKKNDTLKKFSFFTMNSGHKFYTWFRGIAAVMQEAMK